MKRIFTGMLIALWALAAVPALPARAENGGMWTKVYQGSNITRIFIQDDKNLWAVGENAIILHSKDGGRTWEKSFEAGSGVLYDLFMLDRQTGWAVGSAGAIFTTADGGKTWERRQGIGGGDYHCVYFPDGTHGLIGGAGGLILITEDGGKQWQGQQFKFPPPTGEATPLPNSIRSLAFSDENHAIALKDNDRIMITENGGKGWKVSGFPEGFSLNELYVRGQSAWLGGGRKLPTGSVLSSMWFSGDAGKTWRSVRFDTVMVKSIESLWFADDQKGLIAVDGKLYRTSDGGQTWTLVYEGAERVGHLFARDLDHLWTIIGGSIYRFEPNRSAASHSQ